MDWFARSLDEMLLPLVALEDNKYHQPFGFSKVTLVKLLQPPNAEKSMLVTISGIVMLVKLLQLWNAHLPMLVTLLGIVKLVAVLPPAYCTKVLPSFVYEFPSTDLYLVLFTSTVMLVNPLQLENA